MDFQTIDNEILNVPPERHESLAENREKMTHGATVPMVFVYQPSNEMAPGPLLNPGEGGQRMSPSSPVEGETTTPRRCNTKRYRPSAEETREKNRVKAKENRERTKKKFTSLETQVNTLHSENEDLHQQLGDLQRQYGDLERKCGELRHQNEVLQREKADLQRQLEEKEMNPPKTMSQEDQVVALLRENEDLRLQLENQKGRFECLKELLPHFKQVVVIRDNPSVNMPQMRTMDLPGTVPQLASSTMPIDVTDSGQVDEILQILREGEAGLQEK